MKKTSIGIALIVVAGLLSVAQAVQQATTPQGRAYMSGGASDDERQEMQVHHDRYSLWVMTAARKSGAYLANVRVCITDANKVVVFDGELDGPWLFIDLPLGRYTVEATHGKETQRRVTTIHTGDHHQAIFYFDTGDATSASMPDATGMVSRAP